MTTADEKMREEFEEWFSENFEPHDRATTYGYSALEEAWQAATAKSSERIKELEQQLALYQSDTERIWSFIPELKNTPEQYEIHEAVQHIVQQNEQLQEQVAMLVDSARKARLQLVMMAVSVKESQVLFNILDSAVEDQAQTAESYKRKVQAEEERGRDKLFCESIIATQYDDWKRIV